MGATEVCCAQAATHAFGQILEGPSQERLSLLVEQVRAYVSTAVTPVEYSPATSAHYAAAMLPVP